MLLVMILHISYRLIEFWKWQRYDIFYRLIELTFFHQVVKT